MPSQPAGGNYGYDWVGDRIHPPADPNPMVYNKADQLTSWPGMHTYTYYGDGGLHEVKTGQTTVASYTYTSDGLLDTASYNSRTLSNTWDASKNRVSFTADSVTHTFVYDTTAGIPAVIQEDNVYYVREPNGSLICRVSGANTSYYHFDALGSTKLLTNNDGDVTDKYAYDAYGSLISHDPFTGSVSQPYQYVGQLGYYTHWQEPEFKLMQLGVRFYEPEAGRFVSRDAVKRFKESLYAYAKCLPVVMVDPDGRLAGRYEKNCGSYCGGKGIISWCACRLCKWVTDNGCGHPAAKEMCCDNDLMACMEKCSKLERGSREICESKCGADHTRCLIDGKAFE